MYSSETELQSDMKPPDSLPRVAEAVREAGRSHTLGNNQSSLTVHFAFLGRSFDFDLIYYCHMY